MIDLNCDLGEGCGHDEELLRLVTSANFACGAHAGSASETFPLLCTAVDLQVQIGAHPSFPDRPNFGRRPLPLLGEALFAEIVAQIGWLSGLAQAAGAQISYVKPHGALYNAAISSDEYAEPIVRAARTFGLPILALPNSCLSRMSRRSFISEGFADRGYTANGTLIPRDQPGAFIESPELAVRQVRDLIGRGIRSVCVHGDNPQAVNFVRSLRAALQSDGIEIRAFSA